MNTIPENLSSKSILLVSLANWKQFRSTTEANVNKITIFHLCFLNWEKLTNLKD